MKKEVITAFFAASILTFSAMNYTSFAAESLSYAQTVKPRYSIEANTYTDLSINGGKASCYSLNSWKTNTSKAGIFVDVEYCKRCNLD